MVHITKTGFRCFEWDRKLRQEVEQFHEPLANYLRDAVTQVDEDVTLGDIITLVAKDEFLRIFISAYSGCRVGEIYQELEKGAKPVAPEDDVQYCTVAMEVEIWPVLKHGGKKELQITCGFHGCGHGKDNFGLDLSPLAEIAALPFRIEANAVVLHMTDSDAERVDDLEFTPSLLEVLDSIFYDLSFHGNAAEKAARLEEIDQRVQSVKDGTATLVPFNLDEEIEKP